VQTALADNPQLTARTNPPPRIPPLRIVFDRSARISRQNILVTTAREVPTLIVTTPSTRLPRELERAGVQHLAADDLDDALKELKQRGVLSLLVEGGAGLAASFLAGDYVDRLVIFRAPVILGEGALGAFSGISSQEIDHAPRFKLLETRALGDDVMTSYAVSSR
jgi:diaminohydroxyphosphoribosylaminopyrimidine deaminase/5-amino-6-(5-phosphoribosylamino)uracil reductase